MVVPSSEMEGRRLREEGGEGGEGEKEEDERQRQRRKGPLAKKIEIMGRVFKILGI
jgi:hypothetical protein